MKQTRIVCRTLQNTMASQVALVVKNPHAKTGDMRDAGSIPRWARSLGGNSNPLQYSCLENPMDREVLLARVHRLAKSHTRLKRLSTHAQIEH